MTSATQAINVALIEDHDLTRMGLRTTIRKAGLEFVGEAATGRTGLELIIKTRPQVAVVDIGLPDVDGIELTRELRKRQGDRPSPTQILILTMHDNEEAVLAAFAAGATSYCTKEVATQNLILAIRETAAGNSWIDPAIASIVLREAKKQPNQADEQDSETVAIDALSTDARQLIETYPLTERELEILGLIAGGCSNAAIAEKLYITVGTVKTHVRSILNKLCVDDRTQAAVYGLRSGLIR